MWGVLLGKIGGCGKGEGVKNECRRGQILRDTRKKVEGMNIKKKEKKVNRGRMMTMGGLGVKLPGKNNSKGFVKKEKKTMRGGSRGGGEV